MGGPILTWSMTHSDRKSLEAMEMWIWKMMEKISCWVDQISNEKSYKEYW